MLSAVAVVTLPLLIKSWIDDRRRRNRLDSLISKLDKVEDTTEVMLRPNGGKSIPDALGRIERDTNKLQGLMLQHQTTTMERLDAIHLRVDRVEAKVDKLTSKET